jgi:hypothetical protein
LQYIKVFTACPYLLADWIRQSKVFGPVKVQGFLFFCCKKLAPEMLENAKEDRNQGVFKLFGKPQIEDNIRDFTAFSQTLHIFTAFFLYNIKTDAGPPQCVPAE